MLWCLKESVLDRWRLSVARATMLSVYSDGAGRRLGARWQVVDRGLDTTRGSYGCKRDIGTGGEKTKEALVWLVKRFCTQRTGAPPDLGINEKNLFLSELYAQHIKIAKMYDGDAASDEQRAGRLLKDTFPNLRPRVRVAATYFDVTLLLPVLLLEVS